MTRAHCERRPQQWQQERDSLNDVTPEQALRFLGQPMQPLQSQPLHDHRCALDLPAEEAERDTAWDEPSPRVACAQADDQALLLRATEADVDDVRHRVPQCSVYAA